MEKQIHTDHPESIEVPIWWNTGNGRWVRRDALPGDHPEHPYNWVKNKYCVDPELYGIEKPEIPKRNLYGHIV